MFGETYLFVDGAYFRRVYRDVFEKVFGTGYRIDYSHVMGTFSAGRAFVYDCLEDVPRKGETSDEFETRVQSQKAEFDAINRVKGVHVKLGHLSRGRLKQQKEVDVALAVDMLTHSFNKNIATAVLIAGDRDFKPVVESVVQLGTHVEVAYRKRTGSSALARAADSERPITITDLCGWVWVDKYRLGAPLFPSPNVLGPTPVNPWQAAFQTAREPLLGFLGQEKQQLNMWRDAADGSWRAAVQTHALEWTLFIYQDDRQLLAYLCSLYGEVVWQR